MTVVADTDQTQRRPSTGLAGAIAVLRRNPSFTRLYTAQLISFMGDWFATVALLGLVLDLTGSSATAGLLLALETLPLALGSPLAGVVADRLDRRAIMISADVVRALLALALLFARSEQTLWIAFLAVALMSLAGSFFQPASSAALPNMVAREDLPLANVLMGSAWGTMGAIGSALGGLVAVTLGRDAAFIGDALSFAVSGVLIVSIRGRFREGDAPDPRASTMRADLREAVRFAWHEGRVRSVLAIRIGFGVAGGAIVLLAVFAVDVFGRGDGGIALLMSARGLGALAGPFLFRRALGPSGRRLFGSMALALLLFAGGYVAFGLSPSIALAVVLTFVAHTGAGAQWTLVTYGLQIMTPDHIRGRIFSFDFGMIMLTIAGSFWLIGYLAGVFDPRAVAVGVGASGLVGAAVWSAATRRYWHGPLVTLDGTGTARPSGALRAPEA